MDSLTSMTAEGESDVGYGISPKLSGWSNSSSLSTRGTSTAPTEENRRERLPLRKKRRRCIEEKPDAS